MPNELKPCPFCGAKPYIFVNKYRHNEESYMIKCSNTQCNIIPCTYEQMDLEYVIESWNRRADNA